MEHNSSDSPVAVSSIAVMFRLVTLVLLQVIGYRGEHSSDMGSEIEIIFFSRNFVHKVPSFPHKAYTANSRIPSISSFLSESFQ
jgi:hypothetical protein